MRDGDIYPGLMVEMGGIKYFVVRQGSKFPREKTWLLQTCDASKTEIVAHCNDFEPSLREEGGRMVTSTLVPIEVASLLSGKTVAELLKEKNNTKIIESPAKI